MTNAVVLPANDDTPVMKHPTMKELWRRALAEFNIHTKFAFGLMVMCALAHLGLALVQRAGHENAAGLFMNMLVIVFWMRIIALPDTKEVNEAFPKRLLFFGLYAVLLVFTALAGGFLVLTLVSLYGAPTQNESIAAECAGIAVVFLLTARFLFVFPAAVMGEKMTLRQAAQRSKGWYGRIVLGCLTLGVVQILAIILLALFIYFIYAATAYEQSKMGLDAWMVHWAWLIGVPFSVLSAISDMAMAGYFMHAYQAAGQPVAQPNQA
jgi:hypothetical protein